MPSRYRAFEKRAEKRVCNQCYQATQRHTHDGSAGESHRNLHENVYIGCYAAPQHHLQRQLHRHVRTRLQLTGEPVDSEAVWTIDPETGVDRGGRGEDEVAS